MTDPAADAVDAWAETFAPGDARLLDALRSAPRRFLRRHGCVLMDSPAPGYAAAVRIYRSVAVVTAAGLVRSAEMFHVPDLDAFEADEGERSATFAATGWDDRATLFSPAPPPRRLREAAPSLDWNGAACLAAVPEQARRVEFLLNADLAGYRGGEAVFEAPPAGSPAGHRRLRPEAREGLEALLRAGISATAPAALDGFRDRLDRERLEALTAAAANSVRAFNWLSGQDRSGRDPDLALRRTQAARAYPVAWPLLSAPVGPVAEAVSASQPLGPALAAALGIPEGVVRRINGLTAADAGIAGGDAAALSRVAKRVERLPPGAAPRTSGGWRSFFSALALSDASARFLGRDAGAALLASAAGSWDRLDAEALAQAAGGLRDMLADLHSNLVEPAARAVGLPRWSLERTAEAVFGGRSLVQVAEASAWWHERQADVRAFLGEAFPPPGQPRGARTWPPLHPGGPWTAPNGLVVHVLSDEAALVDEHRLMGHCVNQYAANCILEGAHIVSIRRTGQAVPVGTAEFMQATLLSLAGTMRELPDAALTDLPLPVSQFRARKNGMPEAAGWEALWAYCGAIFTGALEIEKDALRDALARRREAVAKGLSDACYDDSLPGAVRKAWELYSPALPRSLAKRGPSALAARTQGRAA